MSNIIRKISIIVKLMCESILFAFSSLAMNKLRTFLSLLGVSIGIFSIVAVFCVVDALNQNIKDGLSVMNNNLLMVSKWSLIPEAGEEYQWWDMLKRPELEEEHFQHLADNIVGAKEVVYSSTRNTKIHYKRKNVDGVTLMSSTRGMESIMYMEIEKGRDISPIEYENGRRVAVIGSEVAELLFENIDPIGKRIKIMNSDAIVIGVLKKSGESMVNIGNPDYTVKIPLGYGKSLYDAGTGGDIFILHDDDVNKDEFISEVTSILRESRGLRPHEEIDFSVNQMTFIEDIIGQVMGVLNMVGWIIGGFSLLIGGFGIVNIMFVSVKERTPQIGIQKALGAKPYFILLQFLVEAAFLSLLGGILGISLVFLGIKLIPPIESFTIGLSFGNMIKGMIVSLTIGVLSGYIPAYFASKLEPVKAINDQ